MGKTLITFCMAVFFVCCNNSGKDSVEKADSANEANLDTALNSNDMIAIDEASSSFMVRVANAGRSEAMLTALAQQQAILQPIKDFAGILYKDHTALNDTVKIIAYNKGIVLPEKISDDKQQQVNNLQKMSGKNFDGEFIRLMIKNHKANIEMFENAMLDTKNLEIRSFADKTLPALRKHLHMADSLQKKYL